MELSFNVAGDLEAALQTAARAAGLDPAQFAPEVRTADPAHGDFQANGVLAYAKHQRTNPRALAEKLVAALGDDLRSLCEVAVAGPGFINLKLKPDALLAWLRVNRSHEALAAGAAKDRPGQTYVIDYSSPNTAKQMHVGHLRSPVIGEAIARMLGFTGARVIRDNHLGDWGTGFGKLILAYKRWLDPVALAADPIEELERLYKLGNAATPDGSPELEEARQELVETPVARSRPTSRCGSNSPKSAWAPSSRSTSSWESALTITWARAFTTTRWSRVYRELTAAGIASESEGALVVFHPEHPRFKTQPFIIRKSDGAANYASTDLATILYRVEHFHARRSSTWSTSARATISSSCS